MKNLQFDLQFTVQFSKINKGVCLSLVIVRVVHEKVKDHC